MLKKILLLSAFVAVASCSAPKYSDRRHGDLNIDCHGLAGSRLYACAVQATGFAERVVRDVDAHCRRHNKQMTLIKITGFDRQVIDCQRARPIRTVARTNVSPVRPKHVERPIEPNSPMALTLGAKPSVLELAKENNIPERGGIKYRKAVVLPSTGEWKKIVARSTAGKPSLHVKAIQRGQSIAEASRRSSQGSTVLVSGRIPEISMYTKAATQHCKVIVDGTGAPVSIREKETGINRYVFRHSINEGRYALEQRQRKVLEAESAWNKQSQLLDNLKKRISDNRAYQNQQCLLVKQQRIPPAPKRIDPKLIEQNAHGACVNIVGSTFTAEQVIEALESAGRFDITSNYQKWTFGEKMSCAAGVSVPEFESLKTRAINWIAPNLGKEYFRKGIRADLESCFSKVKRRCDDGYSTWLANKQKIVNEPRKLKQKCEADRAALANYDYTAYNLAKSQLAEASKLRDIAAEKQRSADQDGLIPFTDQRTYCKLE